MNKYLAVTAVIDWQTPLVVDQANQLASGKDGEIEIVRACFEFVRDQIKHSGDFQLSPTTCIASQVLKQGHGFCYAKSHLLAALLRANNIPAGLCYQRLTITDRPPFCLHGLNAVYLAQFGWYRLDARGNNQAVSAEFSPPTEQLAFSLTTPGEVDLPEIWPEPLAVVVQTLADNKSYQNVLDNLPDIDVIS